MTKEEIKIKFDETQAYLSNFYLNLTEYLNSNEELDNKMILMHLGHALGEIVESKVLLFGEENITPIDLMCKQQYEAEMNLALDNYMKVNTFKDILEESQ